ncbi:cob(I)alamin adenosyltransferase [[Clostridium] aminophilum]|uniref:Cob(I)alamin adenosyltransferase n=1 Tax=[Clostridium] aminophilum TaxID=1526 RepID=A0A1I0ERF0_9FIRM|nr:cob(I)yrinic acid a,c-diamide adenosyltransferase [[Clostridium] aminophilum]SET48090.1 cob(I)alamin adenosyltransferase [[Clostridium] aminophilum]
MGLVHLYCGDGKGKSTAAAGLALRMAGCGKQAVICRFLKNDCSGEAEALSRTENVVVIPAAGDFGFTWNMTPEVKAEAARANRSMFRNAVETVDSLLQKVDRSENAVDDALTGRDDLSAEVLLVLDEACAAVNTGMIPLEELTGFLDRRPAGLEVVLTGRNPAEELVVRADYMTEFRKRKHPYDRGIRARNGVEY